MKISDSLFIKWTNKLILLIILKKMNLYRLYTNVILAQTIWV